MSDDAATLPDAIYISAKGGEGIDELMDRLLSGIDLEALYLGSSIVSSSRHYDHLRHTLHHIGSITGEITTPEILAKIFSSFCIGK